MSRIPIPGASIAVVAVLLGVDFRAVIARHGLAVPITQHTRKTLESLASSLIASDRINFACFAVSDILANRGRLSHADVCSIVSIFHRLPKQLPGNLNALVQRVAA